MNYSLQTLKELIAAKLSVEEILDCLGWTNYELVEALEEQISDHHEDFEDIL